MNKSIEIVVHCYAGKLPLYADHLRFQLASLIHHPPEVHIVYTLFWTGPNSDPATWSVVSDWTDAIVTYQALSRVSFRSEYLPKEQLFRRAIGRHRRSQRTKCDLIWYADADTLMYEGAIDSICKQAKDDGKLYFPKRSLMSKDHDTGQRTLDSAAGKMWPTINPADFTSQRNHFAIGGAQLLGRETAKRVGYFGFKEGEPGYNRRLAKWVQPVDPEKPFAEFRDDCAWRRHHFAGDKQVKIDVENLFRLRHELSSMRPEGFTQPATVAPARRR